MKKDKLRKYIKRREEEGCIVIPVQDGYNFYNDKCDDFVTIFVKQD